MRGGVPGGELREHMREVVGCRACSLMAMRVLLSVEGAPKRATLGRYGRERRSAVQLGFELFYALENRGELEVGEGSLAVAVAAREERGPDTAIIRDRAVVGKLLL